jgi:hypothetical protein
MYTAHTLDPGGVLDQGGSLYNTLLISPLAFLVLFCVSLSFYPSSLNARQSQSFTDDIQRFLVEHSDYENLAVKAVKPSSEELPGLVVERLKSNGTKETVFYMSPEMLKAIQDVDLAGLLILSELQRKDIRRRYERMIQPTIVFGAIIFAIGFIWMLSSFLLVFIPIIVVYILLTMFPAIILSVRQRRDEIRSDVEVAQEYPRFLEALQALVDRHDTLPYGITHKYETRLERIRQHLQPLQQRPS